MAKRKSVPSLRGPTFAGIDTSGNPVFRTGLTPAQAIAFRGDGRTAISTITRAGVLTQAQLLANKRKEQARRFAEGKRIAEEKRLRDIEIKREANRRKISEERVRKEQSRIARQEERVMKAQARIKQAGKALTRLQFQRQLAKQTGLSSGKAISLLRSGTKKEKTFFKRTGISLEKERKKALEKAEGSIITRKPTGETFRGVPVSKIVVIFKDGSERSATAQEEKSFLSQSKVVMPAEKLKGLEGLKQNLSILRGKSRTERIRGKSLDPLREIKLAGLASVSTVIGTVIAWKDLPSTIKNIVKDPSKLGNLRRSILKSGGEFGDLIWTSPSEAVAIVGTELVLLKAEAKAFKTLGKGLELASARLSPRFVGVGKLGNTLNLTTKAGKKVNLKVVGRIGSKSLPRQTIAKQISKAGKRVRVAVSTQADDLVRLIRKRRVIRKPIPNEARFSSRTRKLLNKFDEGKITSKELIGLDKSIKRQSGKGLLERSFFADPKGRIRPSRVGAEKEASLIDAITGDVAFRKTKPQILVFDKVKVQAFPKSFNKIKKKLSTGKALTKTEADQLLKFQLEKSGKFKPLGFVSGEAEITLAPGEIIKRGKKIGVTIIRGRKVPIFEVSIIKPKGSLKNLINKASKGKLNKKQLKTLDKTLKKKTGFNLKSSRPSKSVKRVSIKRIGASSLRRISRRRITTKKISRIPVTRRRLSQSQLRKVRLSSLKKARRAKALKRKTKPQKVSRPRRAKRVSRPRRAKRARRIRKPIRRGRPGRPIKIIRPVKVPRIPRKKRKKRPKVKQGYNVFGRRLTGRKIKGKKRKVRIIKLNKTPLSRSNALSRGSYAIDHSVARTYKIEKIGKVKKLGRITKKERNYFKRSRKKFRQHKIRKGIKKPTIRFIERGKKGRNFLLDTRGEKRGIKLSRIAKQLKGSRRPLRKIKRSRTQRIQQIQRPKRKLSNKQLNNLAKGRQIRLRNLRRRK